MRVRRQPVSLLLSLWFMVNLVVESTSGQGLVDINIQRQGQLLSLRDLYERMGSQVENVAQGFNNAKQISYRLRQRNLLCWQDAFGQLKTANKQIIDLQRIDTSDSQIADGVLFSIGLEFDKGHRSELTLLDFGEPYHLWLPSADNDKRHGQAFPSFPLHEFQGPVELYIPTNREVRLKVPRDVDAGFVRKIFVEHGASVNGSGYCQVKLLNNLEVEQFRLIETSTGPDFGNGEASGDIASEGESVSGALMALIDDVDLGALERPSVHRKLALTFKNAPQLLLVDENNYQANKMLESSPDNEAVQQDSSSKEKAGFVFTSEDRLKVKRGKGPADITLESADKSKVPRDASTSPKFSAEFQLSAGLFDTLKGVLQQIETQFPSKNGNSPIKRIYSASAEAVKVFFIPMQIEDDTSISTYHLLAIRAVDGKVKLMNWRKVPSRIESSMNPLSFANETMPAIQKQVAELMAAQSRSQPIESDPSNTHPTNDLPTSESVDDEEDE